MTILLSACGGGGSDQADESDADAAAALHEAQPLHVRDATLMSESSENGTYSELATVEYSEKVRASTELDKPECLDAANRWGSLEGVHEAPASVAAYEWDEGSVTHMLVRVDEETAAEALSTKPPESCDEYTATHEDGSSSHYGVRDLEDVPRVGDESRAYAIEVRTEGEESRMFSLMYRNGGLVGTTSILGAGELEDYEKMLVEFSEAAVERQRQMLG
ncbi:hypothetical protein HNR06_002507 [Nocardiopsis arvandica]|uniref:DUF3558 domain-containing protein n=1 Tax=Nocardiopsis sinuspersici TaxID=501010 RepID=A0A7Y9XE59_9ACTN|nr:hypothetical protein [Nocardiopsis sinuspersici]NYH52918.1 hypothetical protein [Nocardiopsis sinuspersici]